VINTQSVRPSPGSGHRIDIEHVCLEFENSRTLESVQVLDDVCCHIEPGSFTCIIGPSGCGKSTLLSVVAGYLSASSGMVKIDGAQVTCPKSDRMMVFQHSTLFPWFTAADNIRFGLGVRSRRHESRDIDGTVAAMINLVGLDGFGDRFPHELSGGMRQRIEIARALAVNPEVLLMDEPLGALDALTRLNMQSEILKIWEKTQKTILLVTHDIGEAIFLADQIIVMSHRPAKIREIIKVDMSRPRTRENPQFTALGQHIAELLNATF